MCVCTCVSTCMYVRAYGHTGVSVYGLRVYRSVYVWIYGLGAYVCVYRFLCVYVRVCVHQPPIICGSNMVFSPRR